MEMYTQIEWTVVFLTECFILVKLYLHNKNCDWRKTSPVGEWTNQFQVIKRVVCVDSQFQSGITEQRECIIVGWGFNFSSENSSQFSDRIFLTRTLLCISNNCTPHTRASWDFNILGKCSDFGALGTCRIGKAALGFRKNN